VDGLPRRCPAGNGSSASSFAPASDYLVLPSSKTNRDVPLFWLEFTGALVRNALVILRHRVRPMGAFSRLYRVSKHCRISRMESCLCVARPPLWATVTTVVGDVRLGRINSGRSFEPLRGMPKMPHRDEAAGAIDFHSGFSGHTHRLSPEYTNLGHNFSSRTFVKKVR